MICFDSSIVLLAVVAIAILLLVHVIVARANSIKKKNDSQSESSNFILVHTFFICTDTIRYCSILIHIYYHVYIVYVYAMH